jgi:hypothetical protein
MTNADSTSGAGAEPPAGASGRAGSESFAPFTADELARLSSFTDHGSRGLYLMACISDRIKGPLKPVIVGGFAVEWYTGGGYSTVDLDVAYLRPDRIGSMLESLGFTKVNRHWVSTRYDLQIEVPSHAVDRVVLDHSLTIEIAGHRAVMIGVEDLIIDRLCGYTHGRSTGDLHWATSLYAAYADRLDGDYLLSRARTERVEEALLEAKRQAESSGHDAADREL